MHRILKMVIIMTATLLVTTLFLPLQSLSKADSLFQNQNKILNIQDYFFSKEKVSQKPTYLKTNTSLYPQNKVYEGYDLMSLFKEKNIDVINFDVVVFKAKDGFKINIPSEQILKYKPFLAIRDTSLPKGQNWLVVRDGGRMIDGGPYYLMWNKEKKNIPSEFWAFGVVNISFASFKEAYGNSFPGMSSVTINQKAIKGFHIFQQNCAACHSVNLSGGKLAPEMNVPKNILEYLPLNFISNYIKSPQSFRATANMPAQHLNDSEINLVIEYLEEMKKNKICKSEANCQDLLDKTMGAHGENGK